MKTLGLSQIVKNEAHVITRMLETIKDVADHLTFVDTGSTDGTQDVIKKWAEEHKIPCDIYDREFDNFENCRNYAMEMAKGKTDYCFWLDADEQLVIDHKLFNKNKLDKDLYMFTTHIGMMKYTRNECWNNKKDFTWYGPVHEFIVPKVAGTKITSGLMPGIDVIVKMDGGSWKEDTASKYRSHASMLEDYIDKTDRDPRWIFYTAQSYHDSASIKGNEPENHERLRRSMKYYQERVNFAGGYHEERFYAQYRIGTIFLRLNRPWEDTLTQLLKAYNMDIKRGEPFKVIIEYYQQIGEWNMAYLYAKFAYNTYHQVNLYPDRVLFVDNTLYNWKFAELYANACYHVGKKGEAKKTHQTLVDITKKTPELFTTEDIDRINKNSAFFLR
jgi:glycosyltransferase involved in cell wall biosynthesis